MNNNIVKFYLIQNKKYKKINYQNYNKIKKDKIIIMNYNNNFYNKIIIIKIKIYCKINIKKIKVRYNFKKINNK